MTKKEKLVDLLRQDARLSNEQLAAMLDTSADDVAAKSEFPPKYSAVMMM